MADRDGDGIPDSLDKNPNKKDANPNWQGATNPGAGWQPGSGAQATEGMVLVHDPTVTSGPNVGFRAVAASDAKKWYSYFAQTYPQIWNAMIDPLVRTGVVKNQNDALKRLQAGADWAGLGFGTKAWDYLSVAPEDMGGGEPKVTTQAVQYTPQSIRSVGNNVWMNELGREMTSKEAKAMAKLFNAESRKSPNVYTTGTAGAQTVGMSPEIFLQDQARAQEGYAERQVGVRFMDILDKFISNPTATEQIAMEG